MSMFAIIIILAILATINAKSSAIAAMIPIIIPATDSFAPELAGVILAERNTPKN
jgi:hypothetical protein